MVKLTSELLDDKEYAKKLAEVAGDDVSHAASELGELFQSSKACQSFVSSESAPSSLNGTVDLPIVPGLLPETDQFRNGLPPLPPILDPSLAARPFLHQGKNVAGDQAKSVNANYERLEFVGDAYIELFATRLIYAQFPQLPAGRLSQLRESLVKNETLMEFSLAYKFDDRAQIPLSHINHIDGQKDRAKLWTKTLGDIFEAYVAAVILSDPMNGVATAEKWLAHLWAPKVRGEAYSPPENPNAKQDLAAKVMGKGIKLDYRDIGRPEAIKKEGKVWFSIGAFLTGWGWEDQHLGSGKGLSKGEAGARAAMRALQNPVTAHIAAAKREFDAKTRAQQEDQNAEAAKEDITKMS